MLAELQSLFKIGVQYCVLMLEAVSVIVVMFTAGKSVIQCIRRKERNTRLALETGFALALEFKLGAELLRTIIVGDWNELLLVGAIIILCGAMTFLVKWEKNK